MTDHIAIDLGGSKLRAADFIDDSQKSIKVMRILNRAENV
jgi:hypothetical protein